MDILKEKFGCKLSFSGELLLLNNEEKELQSVLIVKPLKKELILIIDYPKDLKSSLENELSIILPGKTRLPTLKEFAELLEELKDTIATKEQINSYLMLNSNEMNKLLTDFEVSATKKRATPTMKNAWEIYKNIIKK